MRAMEKDRTRRYQTMAELERDLERLLAGDQNVGFAPARRRARRRATAAPKRWPLLVAARPSCWRRRDRDRARAGAVEEPPAPPPAPTPAPVGARAAARAAAASSPPPPRRRGRAAPLPPRRSARKKQRVRARARRRRRAARARAGRRRPAKSRRGAACSRPAPKRRTRTSDSRALAAAMVLASVLAARRRAGARRRRRDRAGAESHYEMGLKLFDAREHEQALIEFSTANEIKPRPAALFMMAQCEYLLGRLKDARAHYQRYATENGAERRVRELARDRVESIDKRPSTFVVNTRPRGRDGRASRPRARPGDGGGERPGAQQLLGPARPLPRRRRQAELPGADAHRRGRHRRDQAAVLQAGPDPGAAGDRDASRRAPRCTSTATAPATRTARTSPPATSRSSPRRPTTSRRRSELTLAPGERRLFTGDGQLRLHVRAALGAAGAAVRVGLDRRAAGRGRGRGGDRQGPGGAGRRVGRAGHRRRHRGRRRGHGHRDAAHPPVHPRQPGVLRAGDDLDRRRRGDGPRLRLAAGRHQQRHERPTNCPPGGGPVPARRSATSCARRSWAACPAWRSV